MMKNGPNHMIHVEKYVKISSNIECGADSLLDLMRQKIGFFSSSPSFFAVASYRSWPRTET